MIFKNISLGFVVKAAASFDDTLTRIPVIASLTKTFGAALLMKIVEEGKLNLQDKMADLLKDTQFQYDKQTIDGYENACKEIKKASRDTTFEYAF